MATSTTSQRLCPCGTVQLSGTSTCRETNRRAQRRGYAQRGAERPRPQRIVGQWKSSPGLPPAKPCLIAPAPSLTALTLVVGPLLELPISALMSQPRYGTVPSLPRNHLINPAKSADASTTSS
jgi:hypothetical protein